MVILCDRTPMVSSNVMALMLSDAKMASLSARVGSSLLGTLADRMTHMSHKLTLTARKSARLSGDPCNLTEFKKKFRNLKMMEKKARHFQKTYIEH